MIPRLSHLLRGAILIAILPAWRGFGDDAATNTVPSDAVRAADLVDQASHHFEEGKLEQATSEATLALEYDPKNVAAYDLRGTIYVQEKLWDRAARDYITLGQINPDPAYKYKLGEIRFIQKDYGNARPQFVALLGDERLGDIALYKIFLCDMLGGHETFAGKELGTINPTGQKPSYFYCHAAWDLYHNQRPVANQLFVQANHLFSSAINELYIGSLVEAQRFRPAIGTFTTRDGRTFDRSHVFLESDGLRASTPKGWITVPLDQLPDDLSGLPDDIREQITRRRLAVTAPMAQSHPLTFTTRAGKTYDQVRWTLEDTGLDILSTDGWISVSFDQLPIDLSSFPQDLQDGIADKRKSITATMPPIVVVSFTSRTGKTYDAARASLAEDGILILTSDGWITVPFADLPGDLSAFPPDWRTHLQTERDAPVDDSSSMKTISFKSKKGKSYDEVRVALADEGLRVLSSDGWIVVPYDQLPTDLSPFPASWCEKIIAKQKEARANAKTNPH